MQQTVLKEHNLNPAIKLNLNLVATPSTLSTLSVLNLYLTSNLNSTFNISADTVKSTKSNKATKPTKVIKHIVTKPTVKPTKAIKPTIAPAVVIPTKATKPTDVTLKEEKTMSLDQSLDWGYKKDPIPRKVLELLTQGANYFKDLTIIDCSIVNRRLHYKRLLYLYNYHALYICLCKLHHNTPTASHLKIGNIYKLLHCNYYWPNLQSFVRRYIQYCHMCKKSKGSCFKKQSVLQPLLVPQQRWQGFSIDFVTGILKVQDCDVILNVVDKLSKERHYISKTKKLNAEGLANLFLKHVWKHHGLSQSIVSNHRSQFISNFWGFLCKRLEVTAQLSTAWHLETVSQTERVNSVMEQYLCAFVNYLQNDWLE